MIRALDCKHVHCIEIPAEEVVTFAVVSAWMVSLRMLPLFGDTDLGNKCTDSVCV